MSRAARLARGWAIGSVATLVAAISHTAAGGAAPSPLAVVLGMVFAGLVGTALIGRRAGVIRMSAIVAISQVAFHLGFSVLSTGPVSVVSSGMHHHLVTMAASTPMAHVHTDPAMWVGHAIAAALTIAYLRRVERSVWTVLETVGRALLRRVTTVVAARRALASDIGTVSQIPVPRPSRLADAISRRGPPVPFSL